MLRWRAWIEPDSLSSRQRRPCRQPLPPVPWFAPLDQGDDRVMGNVTAASRAGHPARLSSPGPGGGPSTAISCWTCCGPGLGALIAGGLNTPCVHGQGPAVRLREAEPRPLSGGVGEAAGRSGPGRCRETFPGGDSRVVAPPALRRPSVPCSSAGTSQPTQATRCCCRGCWMAGRCARTWRSC